MHTYGWTGANLYAPTLRAYIRMDRCKSICSHTLCFKGHKNAHQKFWEERLVINIHTGKVLSLRESGSHKMYHFF